MSVTREDPWGYRIERRGDEFAAIRIKDESEVGRYPTRDEAVDAAEADSDLTA